MDGEKKIGFVPIIKKVKIGLMPEYSIYITNKRLIFGRISGKSTKLKPGLLGRVLMQRDGLKYADMNPEEILKVDKKNFAIPFEDIDRLEVGKRRGLIYGSMIVHLRSGEKKKFCHTDEKSLKELPTILRQVIGNKLVDRT